MFEGAPVVAACLVLAACATHWLATRLPTMWTKCGFVLALSAGLLLLLPAATIHHSAVAMSLILGWEFALKSHSYCVDVRTSAEKPHLSECIFFLLVNPTVIYAERSLPVTRVPSAGPGALRVALGTLTMLGRDAALIITAAFAAALMNRPGSGWLVDYARFCCSQLILLLGLYCAHSGLASIQIGWMNLIGHSTPERYRYPLLARSPQDFWQRWNIWMSRWVNRYIFIPVAHPIVRRRQGRVGPIVGALAAFLGMGLLHDLGVYGLHLEQGRSEGPSARVTVVFLAFGLVLVVWTEVSRSLHRSSFAPRGVPDLSPNRSSASHL